MSSKKFRALIEKGDAPALTELLEKKPLKNDSEQSHFNYEDYNALKDLIRQGKLDLLKKGLENGFPVNADRQDKSFDGTPLHVAVLSECPETVQLLLDNGSSLYAKNGNEETPLLLSAIAGNDQITDILLSHIEPKEYWNREHFSHFHVACMRNRVELVHQFLIFGTNIHQSVTKDSQFWPGFTPLHFAVEYRSIETVEFLVKNGADITIQNKQGSTPLHLAFRKRNKKMIDILLSAQYFFVHNPSNEEGLSHFHIACATNNVGVVTYFLQNKLLELNYTIHHNCLNWSSHNAFRFAICNDCIDVLEHLLKSDDSLLKKNLLHILNDAHVNGSRKVYNLIIRHFEEMMVKFQCTPLVKNSLVRKQETSAEVQSKSSEIQVEHFERFEISQQTKLHVAVLHKDKELVSSILETHHPSIITTTDARGKTPLHLAFDTNQMELVEQLSHMHLKIDENPADKNALSHFHIACTTSNVDAVENFLKKGADVDSVVKMDSPVWAGYTPLHFALQFCQIEVFKLLLNHGANYAAKNSLNLSPFDFAIPDVIKSSYESSNQIIDYEDDEDEWELIEEMLLANDDRNIDGFDDRGITLLHVAAMNNNVQNINSLASVDIINKATDMDLPHYWYAGLTPLHFAVRCQNKEAVIALLDHGADVTIQGGKKKTAAHFCDDEWFAEKIGRRLLLGSKNVCDEDGVSLFHLACKYANTEAVQHFLNLKVDVNEPIRSKDGYGDDRGYTPLHLAATYNADDLEIVKLLLDHGANVHARTNWFFTPLSSSKSQAVLKVMLDVGADPQALNVFCSTALTSALCWSENILCTSILKENGWDINELDEYSLRQLQAKPSGKAALRHYIECLMVLGVDVNADIKNWYFSNVYDQSVTLSPSLVSDKVLQVTFKENCAKELDSMKEIKIDSRTTLRDILLKNSREMAVYSQNETFQRIMESEQDLIKSYPNYAFMAISQLNRGRKRTILLEQGKTSLSFIAKQWMGDLVLETILQFLNDYEIQYLVYAS